MVEVSLWPKFPKGHIGAFVAATNENEQKLVFLPTDPRLVAVNYAGDVEMGSLVYDLKGNGEYDPQRRARLQSAFRVIRRPLGKPNAIGIQLGESGGGDTRGGFYWDQPDGQGGGGQGGPEGTDVSLDQFAIQGNGGQGGGKAEREFAIGLASYRDGGFMHVGHKNDRHKLGEDLDGNPINSLHIWTEGNFYRNKKEDGPLLFEGTYEDGDDANKKMRVHLTWDGATKHWRWYTTTFFFPTPVLVPPELPDLPDPLDPKTPFTPVPTGTPTPGRTTGGGGGGGGGGGRPPVQTGLINFFDLTDYGVTAPPDIGGGPGVDPNSPSTSSPSSPNTGGTRIGEPNERPGAGEEIRGYTPDLRPIIGPETSEVIGNNTTDTAFDQNLQNLSAFQNLALGGLLATAAPADTSKSNVANFFGPIPSTVESELSERPVTGQMAGWGAEGGELGGTYGADSTGASGDPWVYTYKPGQGKYVNGSASGGWVILPPEVKMSDHGSGFAPPDVTQSTTWFMVGPGAFFAAGIPEISNANGPQDGWSWGVDTTTGDLVFYSHNSSGGQDEGFRLVNSSQNIAWRSGTNFSMTLEHAATADRTITFPNRTGTLVTAVAQTYTRNATVVEDRTLLASASATTVNNNNVLAALIADLQSSGLIL